MYQSAPDREPGAHLLPRRPFLGVELAPRASRVEVERAVEVAVEGVSVRSVLAGGTAANAGLISGDRLCSLDGESVRDVAQLVALSRALELDRPVAFRVEREGAIMELVGRVVPLPAERFEGCEVQLDHVQVGAHRLRTIVTTPSAAARHPALLYLQGLPSVSCEHPFAPDEPLRRLIEGFAREGIVTLRLERSGVGDSEGPPHAETDLEAELAGYRAALAALVRRDDVDPSRVFLFGHSLGGMIAPLIARDLRESISLRGVAVFGTSALDWHQCIAEGTRRQQQLAGLTGPKLEGVVSSFNELHALVCREGWTPAEVFAQRPHLRNLESKTCRDQHIFGHHVSLFQQLQRAELVDAWRSLDARVLSIQGEYDWICGPNDAATIAATVNESHPNHASSLTLARVGHDYLAHENLTASFRGPRAGRWDGSVLRATVEWMRELDQTMTVLSSSGNTHP